MTWIILMVGLFSLNVTYAAFQIGMYLYINNNDRKAYKACEEDSPEHLHLTRIEIRRNPEQVASGSCFCSVSLCCEDTDLSSDASVSVKTFENKNYSDLLNYKVVNGLVEELTFQVEDNASVPVLHFEDHTLSLADCDCIIIARNVYLKLKCQQSQFETSIFTTTESFMATNATTRPSTHVTDKSRDLETSSAKDLSTGESLATDLSTEKPEGQRVSVILILSICGCVMVFLLCILATVVIMVCFKKRNRQDARNNVETVNTCSGRTHVNVQNDDADPGTEYAQVNLSLLKPKAKPDVQDDETSPPLVYADLAFISGQQGDAESATKIATDPSNGEIDVAALYSKPIKRQKTKI